MIGGLVLRPLVLHVLGHVHLLCSGDVWLHGLWLGDLVESRGLGLVESSPFDTEDRWYHVRVFVCVCVEVQQPCPREYDIL